MALKIYNTLTKRKEPFQPLEPSWVRMYACGVTVYDLCHIGHARQALIFDVIRRYLEYKGYEVTYVRNFTDIDDKIINRAKELGWSWDQVAEHYIEEYYKDMDRLGVRRATIEPKATDHIPEMIRIIQGLLQKEFAYRVNVDVYFAVKRFPGYCKLSHRAPSEMLAGARVEVDPRKQDPLDFALWKGSKEGEPFWESPWGPGRPGWHIECSVMAMKYLGEGFDIHGGGEDLIFPHHENEIAQSEGLTGKPFARYWVHNGFVEIHAEKMSKSLGNILTVKALLERHVPDTIKHFLLSAHYRNPLDFSEEKLDESARALQNFDLAFGTIYSLREAEADLPSGLIEDFRAYISWAEKEFVEAMDDDFNTPKAFASLFTMVKHIHEFIHDCSDGVTLPPRAAKELREVETKIKTLGTVLGLDWSRKQVVATFTIPIEWSAETDYETRKTEILKLLHELSSLATAGDVSSRHEKIDRILRFRQEVRKKKEWATADSIRVKLNALGIDVEDLLHGSRCRFKG